MHGPAKQPKKMEPRRDNIERACKILRLYLDNRFPRELENKVDHWLATNLAREELSIALGTVFDDCVCPDRTPDNRAYRMYRQIAERLDFPRQERMVEHPRRIARRRMAVRAAAVLIPLMVVAAGALVLLRPAAAPARIVAEAAAGEMRHIVLPDSSEVWLRAGSTVSYPERFGDSREVRMQGEAHFTVKSDGRPFVVGSENVTVEVHGTVFDVADYADEGQTDVKLHSGSIEARTAAGTVRMTPGQKLNYDRRTRKQTVRTDDKSTPAWIAGELVFDGRTMTEIINATERHFGVTIDHSGFTDSGLRHSARFDAGHTPGDVMSVMQILTDEFQYTIQGDKIKITNK
jgi:ferric-dicitrate binding protein FerR (iron transport regulator)